MVINTLVIRMETYNFVKDKFIVIMQRLIKVINNLVVFIRRIIINNLDTLIFKSITLLNFLNYKN